MAIWHVDVTFRDPGTEVDFDAFVGRIIERSPGAQVDRWRRGGVRFVRCVYFLEGDTLREVLLRRLKMVQQAVDAGLLGSEPVTVALAIREASFSVLDTMPPVARRQLLGGRPPKNPPTGA